MPGGRLTQRERQQIALGLADDLAYAEIARRIDRPTSTITREVSHQLLKIKVRGKVSELKFEQELVPAVSEPIKKIWNGFSAPPSQPAMK